MLGTIVNTITIVIGATFGATVRQGIGEKYKKTLFDALGLACLVLGMNASLPNMAKSEYPVLFILSLAIGGVVGTKLDLAGCIDRLNAKINAKRNKESNGLDGLVTGCLLFCIGTFSIVGPVLSCLSPSQGWAFNESGNTFLYTNATLDLVTSAVLAASYGWIMLLAAPILFCWQGMFWLIAHVSSTAISDALMAELLIVGGLMITGSGLGLLNLKDCKTLNLLPALLVPVLWFLLKSFFNI